MKWSRTKVEEDYEGTLISSHTEGQNLEDLFEDLLEREGLKEGSLEKLQQRVDLLQAILLRMLEAQGTTKVKSLIEGATFYSDYEFRK